MKRGHKVSFFIYDGAFFTLVKPYYKNVLNSIELPLGSIFYTPNPFVKKLLTLKTPREKVFFFKILLNNGMESSQNMIKEGFLK